MAAILYQPHCVKYFERSTETYQTGQVKAHATENQFCKNISHPHNTITVYRPSMQYNPRNIHPVDASLCSMMTSSNGNIFRVTGPLCGELSGPRDFPAQRPVTRSFDAFFDLRLNKRLSKQPWGWWFETPSGSLWRQCNALSLLSTDLFHPYVSGLLHWYWISLTPCQWSSLQNESKWITCTL